MRFIGRRERKMLFIHAPKSGAETGKNMSEENMNEKNVNEKSKDRKNKDKKSRMAAGKGFIAEFKKFIMRGNVMDMAVGVIVGGAFTSIVNSLNQDLLTPVLGIFGGTDFSGLYLKMGSGENAPILYYGNFITAVINFLITAFVIFLLLKGINAVSARLSREEKEAPTAPATKKCPYCKSDIAVDATRCPHCTSILDEEA